VESPLSEVLAARQDCLTSDAGGSMSWVHETGYAPALDHEGGAADVLEKGTDPSTPPDQLGPRVIGWRSACQCGWRGTQFYLRSEWPSTDDYALAPEEVEARCMAEWERHLRVAMPVLAIHDLVQQIAQAQDNLVEAVRAARAAGVSWTVIADAAGMSRQSAHERWSGLTQ
jgi:hypothetical protein